MRDIFKDPVDGSFSMRKFNEFGRILLGWLALIMFMGMLLSSFVVQRPMDNIEFWLTLFGALGLSSGVYAASRYKEKKLS